MVDGAVDFLLGKIASLVENEASLLGGARYEFNEIKRELESMKLFLKDADRKGAINEGVRNWVQQVRDVAYDVEDIIDEFMYHIDSQCSGGTSPFMRSLQKTIHIPKNIWTRRRIATNLQRIKTEILAISDRSKRYGFDHIHDTSAILQHHGESSFFVGDEDLVGLNEDKDALLEWLIDEEPQRTIISVVGMGGSGKTTLAGKVYNSQIVKRHFDCHAWITVSQTYTIEDLLKSMVEEFLDSKKELAPFDLSNMHYRRLVEMLVNYLQQNRYVVVLDDVWDFNIWTQINVALPNTHGSRIMLTTRKEEITCFSFGVGSHVHRIQPLPQSEAWALFCKKAFSNDPNMSCPPELETLAHLLVDKCKGLPLAIISIGGLMSSKVSTEVEWRKVYDSLNWELSNNPMLERVKNILLHSFNDLPYHLKHCFLYCCIFPEDYLIQRKRLVRLWIAEGFVEEKGGMTLEEVAETYVLELIHRSLLQVVRKDENGRVKRCRMHDIIRELALSISEREKFCEILYSNRRQETREVAREARRLSLLKNDNSCRERVQIHWSQLRSFIAFDNLPLNTLPFQFRLLRVLDIQGIPIERVPDELVELFNLRYLNLRETKIKELPKSLGKLRKLQVLDICNTNVEALPNSMTKLQNLRCLKMYHLHPSEENEMFNFVSGTRVQLGVCKLKDLRILDGVEAQSDMARQVGSLTQLTAFGITNVRAMDEIELCTSIQRMHLLQSLYLIAKNEEEPLRMDMLDTPPPLLQKLCLVGKLEKVPLWIRSLEHLVFLDLRWSQLKEQLLSHIHALPNLHNLSLVNAYYGQQLHFRAGWFLKLKILFMENFPELNQVIIEKGAMPCIHEMNFIRCKKLKMVPQGIENLTNLQELHLQDVSKELIEQIRGESFPKVQHIPEINHYYKSSSEWTHESLS